MEKFTPLTLAEKLGIGTDSIRLNFNKIGGRKFAQDIVLEDEETRWIAGIYADPAKKTGAGTRAAARDILNGNKVTITHLREQPDMAAVLAAVKEIIPVQANDAPWKDADAPTATDDETRKQLMQGRWAVDAKEDSIKPPFPPGGIVNKSPQGEYIIRDSSAKTKKPRVVDFCDPVPDPAKIPAAEPITAKPEFSPVERLKNPLRIIRVLLVGIYAIDAVMILYGLHLVAGIFGVLVAAMVTLLMVAVQIIVDYDEFERAAPTGIWLWGAICAGTIWLHHKTILNLFARAEAAGFTFAESNPYIVAWVFAVGISALSFFSLIIKRNIANDEGWYKINNK